LLHPSGFDAASSYAPPWKPGQSVYVSVSQGCGAPRLTAAVFADGLEVGDPQALRLRHKYRAAILEELQKTLDDDVLPSFNSTAGWDPQASVNRLKARHSAFPTTFHDGDPPRPDEEAMRIAIVEYLTSAIEDYRTVVANDPVTRDLRTALFVRYLKDWEVALKSKTYPAAPKWWKAQ
jgi:hypothetical protein